MKYCFNCGHRAAGEPLFCNFCGRSYNRKLCPRLHPNPRRAQACSQCGSRDLSTPGPRLPWWAPLLEFALTSIPGSLLSVASGTTLIAIGGSLFVNPGALRTDSLAATILAILWGFWTRIPDWFREAMYDHLTRKRITDGE